MLVAHYLGVDHAGHRYGPNHPEMTRKLDETNNRLRKIIEALPPDVLLYVVGDHGMTETGTYSDSLLYLKIFHDKSVTSRDQISSFYTGFLRILSLSALIVFFVDG